MESIQQVLLLKDGYDKFSASPSAGFNVFSVLDIGETNHSAFLANLLNPNGSHRRGAVFLKHFLNLKRSELSTYGDLEGFHVDKEVPTNKYGQVDIHGRIDILLEKDDVCIIIENKIKRNPKDEPNQLSRYYRYAKDKGFADKQIKLIYLTLDGREPNEESLRGEERQESLGADRVILMSYESDIVGWLEDCLKEVIGITRIQDILLQYQDMVKKITDQPIHKERDIIEILTKKYYLIPELESSIPELERFITEAKTHIQYKFWKKLNKKIAESCDLKRLYNGSVREVSKEYIRHYYQPDKPREYFGITFKLTRCARCELHPTFDIAFRGRCCMKGSLRS